MSEINYAELEEKIDCDDITHAFDNWADDNCEHNKFYECSHLENPEKYCMDCNCPIREQFHNSDYYKDLFEKLLEVQA